MGNNPAQQHMQLFKPMHLPHLNMVSTPSLNPPYFLNNNTSQIHTQPNPSSDPHGNIIDIQNRTTHTYPSQTTKKRSRETTDFSAKKKPRKELIANSATFYSLPSLPHSNINRNSQWPKDYQPSSDPFNRQRYPIINTIKEEVCIYDSVIFKELSVEDINKLTFIMLKNNINDTDQASEFTILARDHYIKIPDGLAAFFIMKNPITFLGPIFDDKKKITHEGIIKIQFCYYVVNHLFLYTKNVESKSYNMARAYFDGFRTSSTEVILNPEALIIGLQNKIQQTRDQKSSRLAYITKDHRGIFQMFCAETKRLKENGINIESDYVRKFGCIHGIEFTRHSSVRFIGHLKRELNEK